jgi:DNA polymerase III epsilon subunit-like protein
LEIAAVHFVDGEAVKEWSALFLPDGVDWASKQVQDALAINHLDLAVLRAKGRKFEDVLPEMRKAFGVSPVWVAHNASFDEGMLRNELRRIWPSGPVDFPSPGLSVCTMQLAKLVTPEEPAHKLANVAQRFHVEQPDAHRATVDATVCGQALVGMYIEGLIPSDEEEFRGVLARAEAAYRSRSRR